MVALISRLDCKKYGARRLYPYHVQICPGLFPPPLQIEQTVCRDAIAAANTSPRGIRERQIAAEQGYHGLSADIPKSRGRATSTAAASASP